jgi:hypothetical protein
MFIASRSSIFDRTAIPGIRWKGLPFLKYEEMCGCEPVYCWNTFRV